MRAEDSAGHSELRVTNRDGSVSIREVLVANFYFREPHLTMRDEVAECIRRFHALVPSGGLEHYFDYEGDPEDLGPEVLANVLHERFYSADSFPNATISMEGSGLYAPGYYLEYVGSALDNPELPSEAGSLQLWVPRTFFSERRQEVLDYLGETAARLPFSCGSVSLGLAGQDKSARQALAARHPGLDISSPRPVSADLGDEIAGVYWQTLLGAPIVERLGGAADIRRALPGEVVDELPLGGCRIVLGADPEIGDVTRGELLPRYRAAAAFLDAAGLLHVPRRTVYFVDRAGMADPEAMQKWHRRLVD